jgi:hypothetical protein
MVLFSKYDLNFHSILVAFTFVCFLYLLTIDLREIARLLEEEAKKTPAVKESVKEKKK